MTNHTNPCHSRLVAEAVRKACLEAARDAFEQAGVAGLCAEGREEMALDAIRSLDVEAIAHSVAHPEG